MKKEIVTGVVVLIIYISKGYTGGVQLRERGVVTSFILAFFLDFGDTKSWKMDTKVRRTDLNRFIPNEHGLHIHVIEHLFPGDTLFLLSHGFTGSVQSHVISTLRSFLTEKQLSNISIDFTNNLNEAEGEFLHHTISAEVEDLEVICRLYRDRFKKIFFVGHSMGCTISTLLGLKIEIDGLLLIAQPFSIRDVIHQIARATFGDEQAALAKWEREGTFAIYKEKDQAFYPLSYEFYRDLMKVQPEAVRGIQVPTVIIYSTTDPIVPSDDSVRLFETISSTQKKLIAIPDAPHSFDHAAATEALVREMEEAIQFLTHI